MKVLAILAIAFCCSIWLFRDAATFALMDADPASGRRRGCYTEVELALGLKSPSIIRYIEGSLVFVIPLIALAYAGTRFKAAIEEGKSSTKT